MRDVTDDMLETADAALRAGSTLSGVAADLDVNRSELRERMVAAGLNSFALEPPIRTSRTLARSVHDQLLVFPDHAFDRYGLNVSEGTSSNYLKLIAIVESTTNSFDIICRKITSKVMADVFIELHNRPGVEVRVLVNDTELANRFSQVGYLIANGVAVRFVRGRLSTNCIIDGQRVLLGSMFWPEHGTYRNFDTVVVQGDAAYIRQLTQEYDEIWD